LITLVSQITGPNNSHRTLLSCGPRYESELYGFRVLGFKWRNIHAIDIFSYSPKIKLGDIHYLNFDPDSFDLIVCGWVIGYSAEPELALAQLHRVVKVGGKVLITWELPLTFNISDNLNLSLYRKSDINDNDSVLPDGLVMPLASKYFKIHRVEIGKLHFNGDVPFSVLVLEK
jgi:SAM-dependent methyltransferase